MADVHEFFGAILVDPKVMCFTDFKKYLFSDTVQAFGSLLIDTNWLSSISLPVSSDFQKGLDFISNTFNVSVEASSRVYIDAIVVEAARLASRPLTSLFLEPTMSAVCNLNWGDGASAIRINGRSDYCIAEPAVPIYNERSKRTRLRCGDLRPKERRCFVEAKSPQNFLYDSPQLAAQMHVGQALHPKQPIFGILSSGLEWRFLKLTPSGRLVASSKFSIEQHLSTVLAYLVHIIQQVCPSTSYSIVPEEGDDEMPQLDFVMRSAMDQRVHVSPPASPSSLYETTTSTKPAKTKSKTTKSKSKLTNVDREPAPLVQSVEELVISTEETLPQRKLETANTSKLARTHLSRAVKKPQPPQPSHEDRKRKAMEDGRNTYDSDFQHGGDVKRRRKAAEKISSPAVKKSLRRGTAILRYEE